MSATLLPFTEEGEVDWGSFRSLVDSTAAAGLIPAVNMDTSYASLIDRETREHVLELTRQTLDGGEFVAGTVVHDEPGARWNLDAYAEQIEQIQRAGGTPVVFPSYGLSALSSDDLVAAHREIGGLCDRFVAFELGTMFVPFGRILDLETYEQLIQIPACIGAKHSSLSRQLEWDRLAVRDRVRPDFMVLTGNDLAIDMVMYGSDYLLGLSTFAPDFFAQRDAMWLAGDSRFYELNDLLQYLGFLAFRPPVPAYRHSAAQFLAARGWIPSDRTHPKSPARPDSDVELLCDIQRRLEALTSED